jgi:parvulin-like peptidyl-prolyl isomerase
MLAAAILVPAALPPWPVPAAAKDAPAVRKSVRPAPAELPIPQAPAVLVIVNGVSIKRSEAMDRAWKQYGDAVLNQLADEILVTQAAGALQLKADPKEVAARIQRIQGQFPDEATFKRRLEASGTGLAELRRQIEDQVLRESLVIKAKDIKVTAGEVKEYFDANKEKFATQKSVKLRSFTVADEKAAGDFMVALKAGADFAKLASQVSLDQATKAKGGDLGYIARGMLQPELEKTVFSLKPGELAGPVRLPNGFAIFKAEEFKSAKPAVFAEIAEDLKQALLADKISKAWPGYIQGLRDQAKYETPGPNARNH